MSKCEYAGCKKEAVYQMTQTVGKKQTLLVCDACAPEWVKVGKDSKFYKVEKL